MPEPMSLPRSCAERRFAPAERPAPLCQLFGNDTQTFPAELSPRRSCLVPAMARWIFQYRNKRVHHPICRSVPPSSPPRGHASWAKWAAARDLHRTLASKPQRPISAPRWVLRAEVVSGGALGERWGWHRDGSSTSGRFLPATSSETPLPAQHGHPLPIPSQ